MSCTSSTATPVPWSASTTSLARTPLLTPWWYIRVLPVHLTLYRRLHLVSLSVWMMLCLFNLCMPCCCNVPLCMPNTLPALLMALSWDAPVLIFIYISPYPSAPFHCFSNEFELLTHAYFSCIVCMPLCLSASHSWCCLRKFFCFIRY
jgi:hypothetical protein